VTAFDDSGREQGVTTSTPDRVPIQTATATLICTTFRSRYLMIAT
jgi:hypothetical protein